MCIGLLRKHKFFKKTFEHEINNAVVEQNYHSKVLKIKKKKTLTSA